VRTQRTTLLMAALSSTPIALVASPVQAQSTGRVPAADEIVVTATRNQVRIQEATAAVEIIGRQQIELRGAQSLTDVLQGATGVRVSTYTEGNFPIVQIRSAGDSGQFQNADILVLIDGIPQVNLNDQSFYDQLPFEAIERVEVVRGPTSALFGRNGVGGTLNVITRRPADTLEATATVTAGSWNYVRPRLTVSGPLSRKVGALVSGSVEQGDGWRDGAELRSYDLFGKLRFELDSRATLSFTGQYLDRRQGVVSVLPLLRDSSELPEVDRRRNFNIPGSESRNKMLQFGAFLDFKVTDQLALNMTGYHRTTDRIIITDGSFIDNINTTAKTFDLFPFTPSFTESIWGLKPQLTWSNGPNLELTAGIDLEWNDGRAGAANNVPQGGGIFTPVTVNYVTGAFSTDPTMLRAIVRRDGTFKSSVFAAFAQARVNLTDALRVTAGLRYDTQDRSLRDPLRPNPNVRADYQRVTPRVALDYRFSSAVHAYVSYSEGFNPPFGGAFAFERAGAAALEPEVARNYEVGVKTAFGTNGFLRAALYKLDRRNLVQTVRIANVNTQVNAGALDVIGFELDGRVSITPALALRGNYSYSKTELGTFVISGIDYAGNEIVGNPRHLASVGLDYQQPGSAFGAGTWFDYVGDRFGDRANTVKIGDYGLLNVYVAYAPPAMRGVEFRAQIFNITNERYLTRTELDSSQRIIGGSPGRPTSFLVTAGYRF
jgi:iron complex outermembrane receptor protein